MTSNLPELEKIAETARRIFIDIAKHTNNPQIWTAAEDFHLAMQDNLRDERALAQQKEFNA